MTHIQGTTFLANVSKAVLRFGRIRENTWGNVLRKTASCLTILFVLFAGISIFSLPSGAGTHMRAILTIPDDRINSGTTFQVTYSTSGVPSSARLYLQRQYGTAHVWKSVKRLTALNGSATSPGVPIGKFAYRVDVVSGRVKVVSTDEMLYSYGTVPFLTLCRDSQSGSSGNCFDVTEQVGTTIFTVNGGWFGGNYPRYNTALSVKTTTCRSATLNFAQRSSDGSYDTYVQFIQSASDPESATTGPNTIGSITATLDGGPWIFNVAGDGGLEDVLVNGTFNCFSTTGF